MKIETQLFISTIVGIIISTSFIIISFFVEDPSIYESPLGVLVAGQLLWLFTYINGMTEEYIESSKDRKISLFERFAQFYGFFVVILALFGLIEFWWLLIVAWVLSIVMVITKAVLIALDKKKRDDDDDDDDDADSFNLFIVSDKLNGERK